jgi:hypothetical protein
MSRQHKPQWSKLLFNRRAMASAGERVTQRLEIRAKPQDNPAEFPQPGPSVDNHQGIPPQNMDI